MTNLKAVLQIAKMLHLHYKKMRSRQVSNWQRNPHGGAAVDFRFFDEQFTAVIVLHNPPRQR